MEPADHIDRLLKGTAGPETLDWLRDGLLRSMTHNLGLMRCLKLTRGVKDTYFRTMRDRNLSAGVQALGSTEAYLRAYHAWKTRQTGAELALAPLFDQLARLEAEGYGPPGTRQAQKVTKRLRAVK